MQACKVVELFLLATVSLSHSLVERYSSVDWTVSFSVMWSNWFTIGGNSVVYQSAPVVDLCRRLFPVVTQLAPRRRSVRRTPARPAGFCLNPVSDESLCNLSAYCLSLVNTSWRHTNQDVDWPTSPSLKQLANASSVFSNVDRSLIQLMLQSSLQYLRACMSASRPTNSANQIRR